MANLARRPAKGLQQFLDQAKEFVNQEETLRAFQGAEETPVTKADVEIDQRKKKLKK
jgi:hypothetical protein